MIYTTCKDPTCQSPLLMISYTGQETHPSCTPTEAENLAREFIEAVQRHDPDADRLEQLLNKSAIVQLRQSALWYAKQGWPVFPLTPGDKLPALPSAHPVGDPLRGKCKGECGKLGHGLYDATVDLAQIQAWWTTNPEYNIGLPTGHKFDVIDVDGPEGVKSLSELKDGVLPDVHGKVSTPRGLHLYVLPAGDGNRAGVRPGIDYRGVGGYVVAAPSRIEFKRYQWAVQPSPGIRTS